MCSAASCACLTCSKWWHATCIISALLYLAPPVVVSTTLSDAIASGQVKPNERDDRECHIGKTLTVAVCGVQQGIVQRCAGKPPSTSRCLAAAANEINLRAVPSTCHEDSSFGKWGTKLFFLPCALRFVLLGDSIRH